MSDVQRSSLAGFPLLSGTDNPDDPGSLSDYPDLWNYDIVNRLEQGRVYQFSSLATARSTLGRQSFKPLVYCAAENTIYLYDGTTSPPVVWSAGGAWSNLANWWWNDRDRNIRLDVGNGQNYHRYTITGKTCRGAFYIGWGTNTQQGGGTYYFQLPALPKSVPGVIGTVEVLVNTAGAASTQVTRTNGNLVVLNGSTGGYSYAIGKVWDWTNTQNSTSDLGNTTGSKGTALWAQNDYILAQYEYEVA